jgi:hypothetical protein
MWNIGGLALSLAIAAIAVLRSRASGGYYDAEVYGMLPATHRRYAAISLAFASFFAVAWALHAAAAGLAALTVYVLIAIFYVTSFLRGYADVDE